MRTYRIRLASLLRALAERLAPLPHPLAPMTLDQARAREAVWQQALTGNEALKVRTRLVPPGPDVIIRKP